MWLLSCAGNDSLERIFAPCQWANLFQNSQEKNLARTFQRTPHFASEVLRAPWWCPLAETANSCIRYSMGGSSILSLTKGIEHHDNSVNVKMSEALFAAAGSDIVAAALTSPGTSASTSGASAAVAASLYFLVAFRMCGQASRAPCHYVHQRVSDCQEHRSSCA